MSANLTKKTTDFSDWTDFLLGYILKTTDFSDWTDFLLGYILKTTDFSDWADFLLGYILKTTDFSLRLQRDCVATATHKQNIMKIFA